MTKPRFATEMVPGDAYEEFHSYADAVVYADQLAEEWSEEHPNGTRDRGWASRDNCYAIRCTDGEHVTTIQVIRADEE